MRLVEVLATGVRGAESGTVEIRRRGTSTFATVYSDYKGGGAQVPTAGLALDTNGGREIYVDEEVDCIVKSSTSATVRTFTVMGTASTTEVKSQSFTGTDYDTGLSAANYPIALDTLLDLWKTNAGAIDWKVLVGGSATTLQTAFSSVAGLFYNVKASTYGATGAGVADDLSAIQAAIDAANAAGGGIVFFPAGSYRITAALNLKDKVSILGAGARATTISIDHASNNAVSVAAGSSNLPVSIRGVTILPAQSNSGKMLVVEAGTPVNVYDCTIGGPLLTGNCVSVANAASLVVLSGCVLVGNSAAMTMVNCTTGYVTAVGTRFVWTATNMTGVVMTAQGGATVVGCVVDFSAVTNAAANGLGLDLSYNGNPGSFIGAVKFVSPSVGTTIRPYFMASSTGPNTFVWGVNTPANMSIPFLLNSATNANHEGVSDSNRDGRRYFVTDNAAAITVEPLKYGVIEVRRTNNGAQTVTFGGTPVAGLIFSLVWNNDHGAGGGTITLTTAKGLANFTVNANSVSHYTFRGVENVAAGAGSATAYWALVGSATNVTP